MKTKEIFLLWKVQLQGFFGVNQARKTKDGKEKKKARSFFSIMLVSVLAFGYLSAQYSFLLASSLKEAGGSIDAMPAVMFAVCCLMILVTSVLKAVPTLFGTGDTDMLMALPVETSSIVASRVLVLYAMDFIYNACLMIPMGIIYAIYASVGVKQILMFIIMFFFAPLVPCVIACILGTFIGWISSRSKRTTAIKNLFSLLFFGGIMFASFSTSGASPDKMSSVVGSLVGKISKVYPLAALFTDAMCKGKISSFLIFIGISTAVFILFCLALGAAFKKLLGLMSAKRTGSKFKLNGAEINSPFKSLYKKELKLFFGSNVYFMNSGIGAVMMLIFTVGIVIGKSKLTQQMASSDAQSTLLILSRLMPFLPAWCICMTCPAASSISLEGKCFSLLKSLPVSAKDVLLSKVAMNLTVTVVPTLVSTTVLAIFYGADAFQRIAMFVVPLLYCALSAQLGLLTNLKYPSLDWKSETEPVKQSTASFISILGFMPLSILPAVLVGLSGSLYPFAIIALCAVLAVLSLLCYRSIVKNGEKKLAAIS